MRRPRTGCTVLSACHGPSCNCPVRSTVSCIRTRRTHDCRDVHVLPDVHMLRYVHVLRDELRCGKSIPWRYLPRHPRCSTSRTQIFLRRQRTHESRWSQRVLTQRNWTGVKQDHAAGTSRTQKWTREVGDSADQMYLADKRCSSLRAHRPLSHQAFEQWVQLVYQRQLCARHGTHVNAAVCLFAFAAINRFGELCVSVSMVQHFCVSDSLKTQGQAIAGQRMSKNWRRLVQLRLHT
jgi:hypothetical protein